MNQDDPNALGARLAVVLLAALSLPQAAYFALGEERPVSRVVAVSLSFASLVVWWAPRMRQRWRTTFMSLLGLLIAVNLAGDVLTREPPFAHRLLLAVALYGYASLAVAGLIALVSVRMFTRAVVATCSCFLVLGAGEALLGLVGAVVPVSDALRWEGSTLPDSVLGERYAPFSVLKSFYPDNPRGYFRTSKPSEQRWKLETHNGNEAGLEFLPAPARALRVTIPTATVPPWQIQVYEAQLPLEIGFRYVLRYRARADAPRTIAASTTQAHAPWRNLGLYREVRLDTTWQAFSDTLSPTESDGNARLSFVLGGDPVSVELADVDLRRLPGNDRVEAPVKPEYYVSYRFNSMGCRGQEYPLARDSQVTRILMLGASYTVGVGVHEEDTYAAQLEQMLNGATKGTGHPMAEVINCGVSGYSTRQSRLLYEKIAARYAPDVVLLTVVRNDDIGWLEQVEKQYYTSPGKYEQLFLTWRAIQEVRNYLRRPPHDYSRVRDEVRMLAAACAGRKSKLAILIFRTDRYAAWDALASAMRAAVEGTGVPVLDIGPRLANRTGKELTVHRVDGHPNEIAHRAAAVALREFLSREGLVDRGRN